MPERKPDLEIHIVAPSAYDDNGRLKQYSRILMLPPAFAVLDGIADKAAADQGLNISIRHYNERTLRGDRYLSSILHRDVQPTKKIVLFTAKSFELPRTIDLAVELKDKDAGLPVVIGGIGATLADWKTYDYITKKNISINVGEGENTVGQIIQDVTNHQQLKPVYRQNGFVDLRQAPLPRLPERNEHNQTMTGFAALDISEGCPYRCTYCSARKLRGMNLTPDRSRDPEATMEWIKESHARGFSIMILDDNFRMSAIYQLLKEPLTRFNEELKNRGDRLSLLVQLDADPSIIKEAKDLAAMGVTHAFFGLERLDSQDLAGSQKKQNKPESYKAIVDEFHKYGIEVGSGVMIGWPSQTPASIHAEMQKFAQLVDIAHPYAVTTLPGTDDYCEAIEKGELITWDMNSYDSTRFVRNWFQNMTLEEAKAAYYQSFFDLFPLKNLPPTVKLNNRLYGRGLAELGKRFYGRPFHVMMDGIPHFPLPGSKVKRPVDGFKGFELTPEDLDYKEAYLSQFV